jgi:excisionase family DNA binding protein
MNARPTTATADPRPELSPARRDESRLLTADEVADRLGVGVKWVWAQARAGSIPHVRLGRYRRFRPETIDRWIADLERHTRT